MSSQYGWFVGSLVNQKGYWSFFFLLGENSGIHQEAKQTTRYGSSDWTGPQAPSANKDLTGAVKLSPERPALLLSFVLFLHIRIGLSFDLYSDYFDSEEVGIVRALKSNLVHKSSNVFAQWPWDQPLSRNRRMQVMSVMCVCCCCC